MIKLPYFIVLYGPTGVGKTECADLSAQQIPCEIVNMDMGQFYQPLSIGTAKPDWQKSSVPHHLFDVITEPTHITVTAYRDLLINTMHDIWRRNRVPLIVGGSSFYLRSILFPPRGESIDMDGVEFSADEQLWDTLYAIDPIRAEEINRHDIYRLKRALAIWYVTGTKPSQVRPVYDPPAPFTIVCLTRNRQDLHERINKRVKEMLAVGWMEEAKGLVGTAWEQIVRDKNIIGYPEIIDYISQNEESEEVYEKMVHSIQKQTRRYAKRQMSFWRSFERVVGQHIISDGPPNSHLLLCNLTLESVDSCINKLKNY